MKLLPLYVRAPAQLTLKYVTKMTLWYLKGTEEVIARGEDRLKLYHNLESGYSDEGEAVMHISNVVSDLVKIGNTSTQ